MIHFTRELLSQTLEEIVKRWSNDLERNAVSIFKNLRVLSKITHEDSVLFQIKHYSVQSANDFVVCITNRGYSLT